MSMTMDDVKRLWEMSDDQVQQIWDAIWECAPFERPEVEWQEDVYSEITRRGLRSGPKEISGELSQGK